MRENQSDGEGGWERPRDYVSPWAPRDEEPRRPGGNPASPPENDYPDAIVFGTPTDPASGGSQGSHPSPGYGRAWPTSQSGHGSQGSQGNQDGYENQDGYGNQGRYGQAWYGSQDDQRGQAGYGNQGGYGNQDDQRGQGGYGNQDDQRGQGGYRNQDGYGDRAGYGADGGDGGFGASGWAMPDPPPGRSRRGGRFLVYIAVAALAAGIGAGVTVAVNHHGAAPAIGISRDVPQPGNNAAGSGSSSATLNRAAVTKKVDPGLVYISSTLAYNGETAEGTGMIISSSGLVLTNNHVIDQGTKITVALADPVGNPTRTFPARVVGYDATDDVALLRLQGASGLPTETFGNSSQVTLGTPVLALGNAQGHDRATPAAGIINALNRSIQASDEGSGGTENLNHMLQTNAEIQQGDSGGALANNAGQVIGMITAANTATSSRGGSGGVLGFAIPINTALTIARQIDAGQASSSVYIGLPGFLGVEVADSSSSDPQQQAADAAQGGSGRASGGNGMACQTSNEQAAVPARVAPIAAGALILGVLCDSAAASAGMVPGDVITSVAGQPITTPGSLISVTARYHPRTVVTVIWVSLNGMEHTTRMLMADGPAR